MVRDIDNYCTKLEILQIRQRSTFLCCAHQLALSNMNKVTWHRCCKRACNLFNSLGSKDATFYKTTIAKSNKIFRKFGCFPHPNPNVQCGKLPLPRLLGLYPDAKDHIVSFWRQELRNANYRECSRLHHHLNLPRLALTWQKVQQCNDSGAGFSITTTNTTSNNHDDLSTINYILNSHGGLESMSLTTTWRWMRFLRFKYDTRNKLLRCGHDMMSLLLLVRSFADAIKLNTRASCKRWVQLSVNG